MNRHFCIALLFVVLLALLSGVDFLYAQGTAGSAAQIETRAIVDVPTAGMLRHGAFALGMEFYQNGGMTVSTAVGIYDRLMFGIAFGGTGLIGDDHPRWNPAPAVLFKVRVLDETFSLPAFALGFDSQGKEPYLDTPGRYTIKSPGFFFVASKNYEAYGTLSFHGGINYSMERSDGDTDPNLFAGVEKSIGSFLSLLGEYNLGWNDSNHDARGRGRGYLNVAVAVSAGNGLTLRFAFKDLLHNQSEITIGNRVFSVDFVTPI